MALHCPHCNARVDPCDLEERFNVPAGCICDPHDWGDPDEIPSICKEFIPYSDGEPELCRTCEHDRACHQQ